MYQPSPQTKGTRGRKPRQLLLLGRSIISRAEKLGFGKTIIVAALIAAFVGYFALVYVIEPLRAEIKVKRQALTTLRAQNAAARQIETSYPEFIQQFKKAWADYQTSTQLLPEEVEVSGVLAALQQLAEREGIKITLFNAVKEGGQSQIADKLQERIVPAQVVGTHKAVTRFLNQIASYPRIIHVREFSISSLKNSESVDLVIAAYYTPKPTDLPPLPPEVETRR